MSFAILIRCIYAELPGLVFDCMFRRLFFFGDWMLLVELHLCFVKCCAVVILKCYMRTESFARAGISCLHQTGG